VAIIATNSLKMVLFLPLAGSGSVGRAAAGVPKPGTIRGIMEGRQFREIPVAATFEARRKS